MGFASSRNGSRDSKGCSPNRQRHRLRPSNRRHGAGPLRVLKGRYGETRHCRTRNLHLRGPGIAQVWQNESKDGDAIVLLFGAIESRGPIRPRERTPGTPEDREYCSQYHTQSRSPCFSRRGMRIDPAAAGSRPRGKLRKNRTIRPTPSNPSEGWFRSLPPPRQIPTVPRKEWSGSSCVPLLRFGFLLHFVRNVD